MTIETTNATSATAFDFNQHFESAEAAQAAATAADLSNFRITRVDANDFIIIDAKGKAAKGDKAPKAAKPAAKGKGKGSAEERGQKAANAIAKGKTDKKAAADLAKAKSEKAANPDPNAGKDMHYSIDRLPTKEQIEGDMIGMQHRPNPEQRGHFKAALEGKLPAYDIFPLTNRDDEKAGLIETADTHKPFRTRRDELYALRNKGRKDAEAALKETMAWRGGRGTRMTCSSTIPLGRFHQQLILALKAKISSKKKEARAAAKNGNGATAAPQENQPTS